MQFLIAAGLGLLLLWGKNRELRAKAAASKERLRSFEKQLAQVRQELQDLKGVLRSQEQGISEISELYGLSKQFLATLDQEQALRITEESLVKALPRMGERPRSDILEKIRAQVQQGEISMESLVSILPSGDQGIDSWEKGGIVLGQLALGLKRVSLYGQVQESAIHDGLTGLLVRRHFFERLEEEVGRASRRGTRLAFLMVDLDYFKQVNDTYGHLVGDHVLREVARRIQASVRDLDLVGRYGGEEFGVVLPEAGRALGIQIADRIRQAIGGAAIFAYDEKVQITVSIGVALCPEDSSSADGLIEKADEAMYRAKAQGRNRTVSGAEGKTGE